MVEEQQNQSKSLSLYCQYGISLDSQLSVYNQRILTANCKVLLDVARERSQTPSAKAVAASFHELE
jgi:hypothetical protein